MKIHKITSAIPGFRPVTFDEHFSVILGIPKSTGQGKSHNLGKTTLISLIDHILFGARLTDRIKAIKENFDSPAFSLIVSVDGEFNHIDVDYSKRKRAFFEKYIRQSYEYFIRFQDDYKDEFRKISVRGKDSTWKPLLLRLLGFNERPLIEKYEVESTISGYNNFIDVASTSNIVRSRNTVNIAQLEARRTAIAESIENLDLSAAEEATSKDLAHNVDTSIAEIKKLLFFNRKELASVNEALSQNTFVDLAPGRLEEIYDQIGIYFGSQIRRDIDDVKNFFEQVTENRVTALSSIKRDLIEKIAVFESDLRVLNEQRTQMLKLVVTPNTVNLYKELSAQLALTEAELQTNRQDVFQESIQAATAERSRLQTQQLELASAVAREIDENDTSFTMIKEEYSKIMDEVMDIDAELVIEKNSTGNIEFKTISWRNGKPTQELKG